MKMIHPADYRLQKPIATIELCLISNYTVYRLPISCHVYIYLSILGGIQKEEVYLFAEPLRSS